MNFDRSIVRAINKLPIWAYPATRETLVRCASRRVEGAGVRLPCPVYFSPCGRVRGLRLSVKQAPSGLVGANPTMVTNFKVKP